MTKLAKIEAQVCGLSLYRQNDLHPYVCNHVDKLHSIRGDEIIA